MPRPIGPQPATTTTSSKVMPARSTACSAQDSGSANAAWAAGRSLLTLCTRASARNTMYDAMPPGLLRLKPNISCGPHIQYWPRWQ